MQVMQRVGLIGYGAIGRAVHRLLMTHGSKSVEVAAILIREDPATLALPEGTRPLVVRDLDALVASDLDLVVECAGHEAVDAYATRVLRAGCDMVLVSVGALADAQREQNLRDSASATGRQVLLPAGAIGCVDWLGAARTAGLTQVLYRSRKPPQAWVGSAAEDSIALAALTEATPFFRGSARQAALRYPRNANVAATVALAGLGLDATQVELIADPGVAANVHEIEALSAGGNMSTRIGGYPDPDNARTSVMTAHSVVRTILQRSAALVI
jgi:aspartate dehydrogenase